MQAGEDRSQQGHLLTMGLEDASAWSFLGPRRGIKLAAGAEGGGLAGISVMLPLLKVLIFG